MTNGCSPRRDSRSNPVMPGIWISRNSTSMDFASSPERNRKASAGSVAVPAIASSSNSDSKRVNRSSASGSSSTRYARSGATAMIGLLLHRKLQADDGLLIHARDRELPTLPEEKFEPREKISHPVLRRDRVKRESRSVVDHLEPHPIS